MAKLSFNDAVGMAVSRLLGIDISGKNPDGTEHVKNFQMTDAGGVPTPPAAVEPHGDGSLPVDAILNSGLMYAAETKLAVKYAAVDVAGSGDNTIVAAVTSPSNKKIRVLSLFLISAGTVTTRFESGAGGTALTGQMNLVANSGYTLPFNPAGWFETAAGVLLNLELSAAISVDGSLSYIEVAP